MQIYVGFVGQEPLSYEVVEIKHPQKQIVLDLFHDLPSSIKPSRFRDAEDTDLLFYRQRLIEPLFPTSRIADCLNEKVRR
jgi:hypothetical protein